MIHQASSHVRLFSESLITLKYISLDPNTRSNLFWGYSEIEAYKITSAMLGWEKDTAKEVHVKKVEALFQTMKEKYKEASPVYTFVDKNNRNNGSLIGAIKALRIKLLNAALNSNGYMSLYISK